MKRSTQSITVVTAAMVLLGLASPAPAIPIIYQVTGIESGTIGGSPFTNVLVTVTLTGDTSNVAAGGFCPSCLVNLGTTTVNIPGIGTAAVTDATEIVATVMPFVPDVGFPLLPYVVIGTLDHPPATDSITGIGGIGSSSLLGYDLRTSIGPITASPGGVGHDPCCVVHTALGNLIFASNIVSTGQGTFAATVPEPSSLLLFGAAAVVLAGYRLRRRSR
jgi:PEP-CTERM motif